MVLYSLGKYKYVWIEKKTSLLQEVICIVVVICFTVLLQLH
jgi:hypothetical protein